MKVLKEGHLYELDMFEKTGESNQKIQFIEKVLSDTSSNELITVNNGTTNEEVLEMLIDRLSYLQNKFPCKENACCITHLQEALMWLEKRTKDRIKRGVEGKQVK